MNDRRLAFLYSPELERLHYPPDCPFKTERVELTRRRLTSFGLLGVEPRVEIGPRRATLADLQQFHTAAYLKELQRAAAGDLTLEGLRMGFGGPDTPVFEDMVEYGARACGAALTGAELLLEDKADVVFNLAGGFHHAMPERAGGFCYLNDMALACLKLAGAGKRVFYLDLDAHHGDGVQRAFYHRRDVMTVSLHESGRTLYPWGGFEDEIGEGEGEGYNVNIPLPAEAYDDAFLHAFDRIVVPLLDAYFPGVIVLELGMDILAGDPLTHLRMTNNVIADVIERLLRFPAPILVAGGGGYHVENTVRGWALAWRSFCEENEAEDFSAGLGGVMLGSSEWAGGLQDRVLPVSADQRRKVEPELRATVQQITDTVFRLHSIRNHSAWRMNMPSRFA